MVDFCLEFRFKQDDYWRKPEFTSGFSLLTSLLSEMLYCFVIFYFVSCHETIVCVHEALTGACVFLISHHLVWLREWDPES